MRCNGSNGASGFLRRVIIVRENETTDVLYIVASGWLHGSVRLPDGGRQILRFYFVGDITTSFSIAWGYSAATLTAVSACTLYELPGRASAVCSRSIRGSAPCCSGSVRRSRSRWPIA